MVLPLPRTGRMAVVGATLAALTSCGSDDAIPLRVDLGTRSISKLPFVIAEDRGLYRKYGLAVSLRMPAPADEDAINTDAPGFLTRQWRRLKAAVGRPEPPWIPDIVVDGHTPDIVQQMNQAARLRRVAIAANDCVARAHIIGNRGISRVEQLAGKRLGISARTDTTLGYVGLMLARRMGWDPVRDISIKLNGREVQVLRDGLVEGLVASEFVYAEARKDGYPILVDTREWNLPIGGNSVLVPAGWLDHGTNREAARRFLQAVVEGHAIFHRDRAVAMEVMAKWHAVKDAEVASLAYDRGQWLSRKPYPCYEGIAATMQLYDSLAMRQYAAADFYDDRIVRELDTSGFIDSFYK